MVIKLISETLMILGIDVGGTHTDAVLLDSRFDVVEWAKVLTNPDNLIDSFREATSRVLNGKNLTKLERIVLSTTMSTNAIVQNKVDRVGMILAGGPGLAPEALHVDGDTHFVSGYMSHRGIEAAAVDESEVLEAAGRLKASGIRHGGIVGKFSTRNPGLELKIGNLIEKDFDHLSFGHRMSGNLNYPRRIATTYLNAAIWSVYNRFVDNLLRFVGELGVTAPVYILKADGGTSEIRQSAKYPVGTILSGPAASIMGILSLTGGKEDAVALDIGGTTTDIALFADGVPLLEPFGVTIAGRRTLVRGLKTRSIGVGGDSRVRWEKGELRIGPEREGPARAFGGPFPTPTDAMIVLGLTGMGNREKAFEAMAELAEEGKTSPGEMARIVYEKACEIISGAVRELLEEVNNKPVYTIHEILEGKIITPKVLFTVGGPAEAMAPRIGEHLGCPSRLPEHAMVANAVGAALARTTAEITLLADTEKKTLTIVEEGLQQDIPGRFSRDDALFICRERLLERALKMGAREADLVMEIIEDQVFNMVRGFYTTGKNIRIKAQIKPGLIARGQEGAP